MTAKELIEELQKYNSETEVHGIWEGISVPVHGVEYDEKDNIIKINVDNYL